MPPFSHGFLEIAAFETRIDKSNAKRPSKADEATRSPYFPPNDNNKTDVTCSLLEHEAEQYGYKIGQDSEPNNMNVIPMHETQIVITRPCKQYPRLLSRSLMDKYAHLFGLVPVSRAIKNDHNDDVGRTIDYNLESIRQSTTPSADRRRISSSE